MIDFAAPKAWRFDDVVQRFDADDTLRYALALGLGANPTDPHQLRFASEDAVRAPLVLPTFAVVLGYPGSWMQNPATGIDFTKVAHSEEGVVWHAPTHPGQAAGRRLQRFCLQRPQGGRGARGRGRRQPTLCAAARGANRGRVGPVRLRIVFLGRLRGASGHTEGDGRAAQRRHRRRTGGPGRHAAAVRGGRGSDADLTAVLRPDAARRDPEMGSGGAHRTNPAELKSAHHVRPA